MNQNELFEKLDQSLQLISECLCYLTAGLYIDSPKITEGKNRLDTMRLYSLQGKLMELQKSFISCWSLSIQLMSD